MLKRSITCFAVFMMFGPVLSPCLSAEENDTIILATTTSVQDTGLLDVLAERFSEKTGYTVKPVAVGTGQALQLGREKEADILWVHSPDDEIQFVKEGFGLDRTVFMHNDFVLLGQKDDPAGCAGAGDVAGAFKKINQSGGLFISRGDNSGTHKKELKIWKEAGTLPDKKRYLETGQGMAQAMRVADEKEAYCLADRSTYVSLEKTLKLIIVSQGDEMLRNEYSIILVNPQGSSRVNYKGAKVFFDFLLSKDAKEIIENFGKEKFGQKIFFYDYKLGALRGLGDKRRA